jgi:hypothetical protein
VVPARPRRVDELAAPVRGPRVYEHHDACRRVATSEQRVHGLRKRRTKRRAVVPHGPRAHIALDDVDRRIAPFRILVVAWRHIDLDGALGGIAERIVREQLADDDMPLDTAHESSLIGVGIRRPADLRPGHARDATAPASTRVRAPVANTTKPDGEKPSWRPVDPPAPTATLRRVHRSHAQAREHRPSRTGGLAKSACRQRRTARREPRPCIRGTAARRDRRGVLPGLSLLRREHDRAHDQIRSKLIEQLVSDDLGAARTCQTVTGKAASDGAGHRPRASTLGARSPDPWQPANYPMRPARSRGRTSATSVAAPWSSSCQLDAGSVSVASAAVGYFVASSRAVGDGRASSSARS